MSGGFVVDSSVGVNCDGRIGRSRFGRMVGPEGFEPPTKRL